MSSTTSKNKSKGKIEDKSQQDTNEELPNPQEEDDTRNEEHEADIPDQDAEQDQTGQENIDQNDAQQRKNENMTTGLKRVSPGNVDQKDPNKTVAVSVRPTRRFQGRATMLTRNRDLSQDRKRILNNPSNISSRPPSLTPLLLKEGGSLGSLLTEIPDFYTDGGETIVAEVAVQFLNAQVRVLKDELQRVIQECVEKEEMVLLLEKKLKEVEQERNKLHRETANKQQLADKYQRISDETKSRCEKLENQCSSLKKEVDILRQGQKQVAASKGTVEVRLSRALEDVEKYKSELRQIRQTSKESTESDKRKIEELTTENRRLEKQKNELLTAFKKQMKLIDNLKKQKMHLEAAKALQFTEEEFMRALDWGT